MQNPIVNPFSQLECWLMANDDMCIEHTICTFSVTLAMYFFRQFHSDKQSLCKLIMFYILVTLKQYQCQQKEKVA